MNKKGLSSTGYFLLAAVIIGWGTSWPFLKIGLNEIPPWTYRGLIAPAAGGFIFILGYFMRQDMSVPSGKWRPLIIAAFFNVLLWHIFSAWGIRLLASGQASIIGYTMPLWAIVVSIMLRDEQLTLQRFLGLIIGIAGLATLTIGEFGIFATSPLGTLFMLVAAVAWGIGTALQKRTDWQMSATALAGWQLLIGGFPITLIAVFIEHQYWRPLIETISMAAIGSTIFILAYPIIFCWFAWFRVVKEVPVSVSSVSIMLVPVIGVYSGNLVLSEPIGWREISGLVLVCSALALVLLPSFMVKKKP